ncbi:MAG: hypothetical protein NTX56_12670, partial [Proteobacteria bacterium]|nr:hypothetical protein [Pseudomonadota bacterium]
MLLAARGGISQTSSGVITASKLGISIDNVTGLTPALTSVDLSTANNSVGTLAAKLNTANESFKFSNVGAMTIRDSSVYYTTGSGSVMYSMNGLSTQGAIELTAGGALAISQPITSTVGNISLATSAGITSTYSGTAISANGTGTVDLIAGWTSGTAISAHTFTTGNGKDISLTNSRIYSGGTMTLNAGNNVEVNATAAAAGFESAGSQTINAKGIITLTAGTSGHDQKAYVKASGTQTIAADKISLSGGGASGPNSYNNYATIFQDSTSAVSQSFTLSGTGTVLTLQAGSGSGSGDTTNSYGCATGCSSNFATISNYGSSGQSFSFTGATPSISLTGGTIGVRNFAGIFNVSSGSQTIGSSSNRPAITLTGGSSGGSDAGGTDYSGFGFKAGNGTLIVSGKAELTAGSDVAVNQSSTVPGTQAIYASQITLEGTPQTGTSTGISGAGLFSASNQAIDVTGGTLALNAGISSGQSRTRIWSMGGTQTINASTLSVAGASNTATTGDNRATINAWGTGQQMTLASALTLTGGTGSNNTSAANVLQTGSGAQTITMTGSGAQISLTGPYVSLGTENSTSSSQTITFNNGGTLLVKGADAAAPYAANSGYASVIGSAGAQTITGVTSITLTGGGTTTAAIHDAAAAIRASGTQTISAGSITLSGGGSTGGYNDYAGIYQNGASGAQSITLSGSGIAMSLTGGSGTGTTGQGDTSSGCQLSVSVNGCSSNYASIYNKGSGGQSITFTGTTPSIALTAGSNGARNSAGIYNSSTGNQTIGSTSVRPTITLMGSNSGGNFYSGTTEFSGFQAYAANNAVLESFDSQTSTPGTQTIYANTLTLKGTPLQNTASGHSGAGIYSGGNQTVTVTNALSMSGGDSTGSSRTRLWSTGTTQTINAGSLSIAGYADSTARFTNWTNNIATIGHWGDLQQITLATSLTLQGGTGSFNSSPANILQNSTSGAQTITMTGSGASISLTGPMVAMGTNNTTSGPQTITFQNGGSIVLQGANTAAYYDATVDGNYGPSIGSAGTQTISGVSSISVTGGSVAHGNARISAEGTQTISAHQITLTGGSSTGYDNAAKIGHGTTSGNQSITVTGTSGSLTLTGGSGSGTGDTASTGCSTTFTCSSSYASIYNGTGTQTIDFSASGGSIALTGGTVGKNNYASIENDASTQQKIGSSTAANYPSISLTGGASGGAWNTTSNKGIGNSAEISTSDSSGSQTIQASSIVLSGSGNNSTVGGAFIGGGTSQNITTTGNVTLTGGYSTVATPGNSYNIATAAGIGATSNISMTLNI